VELSEETPNGLSAGPTLAKRNEQCRLFCPEHLAVIQWESSEKQMSDGRANLKPIVKNDPRINRKGRPKSFDQLRALAQAIAQEEITGKNGQKLTVAEAILRRWAASPEPTLQKAFMEYAYGKAPDKIEGELTTKKAITLFYDHERPGRRGKLTAT